jgi:DNA topoisomerase I
VFSGRYGPYVSHGGVNATLRDVSPEEVTLQQAIDLLAARPQPAGKRRAAAPKAPKAPKQPKQPAAAKEAAAPSSANGKKTTPKPKSKAAKKKRQAPRKTAPAEG